MDDRGPGHKQGETVRAHQTPEAGPRDEWPGEPTAFSSDELEEGARTLRLHEERLVAQKELRHLGDVEIRTEIEEQPGRLEVDALREEVQVEHVPIGRVVSERQGPREEDGSLIVPVYEEQLVVSKRLVLREELHIRRLPITERQLFEDTLRRERLVIDDLSGSGMVHERYPDDADAESERQDGSFLSNLVRRVKP